MAVKDKLVNLEDLKVVGDVVGDLKSQIIAVETATKRASVVTWTDGGYINTSGNTVNINSPTTLSGWRYAVIDVNAGEEYIISVAGGGAPRAWCFINDNATNNNISSAGGNVTLTNYKLTVPITATKLVLNDSSKKLDSFIVKPASTLVIASSGSAFKDQADIVCTGDNDQILINYAIAKSNCKTFYFTDDSEFSINSEIILADGVSIISNGAVFKCPDQSVYNYGNATNTNPDNTLDLVLTDNDISGLVVGQWVEIHFNTTRWYQGKIVYINYSSKAVKVDIGASGSVVAGTIRNVSSCFVAKNATNVRISGVKIDWNKAHNPTAENTGYEQNCILFEGCTESTVENCEAYNTGRRGILTKESKEIYISHCSCHDCDEHGIDIFDVNSRTDSSIKSGIVVDSCLCYDNLLAGIQLHGGSWAIVKNCVCYNNSEYGIGTAEYAKYNIISENVIYGNTNSGVLIRTGSHNNTVVANTIENNTKGIYILGVSGSYNSKDNCVCNNTISSNTGYGLVCTYSDGQKISNNRFIKNSIAPASERTIQLSFSSYNDVSGNYIECYEQTAEAGIRIAGGSSDYSNISNNITVNGGTPTYTGSHMNVANNFEYNV